MLIFYSGKGCLLLTMWSLMSLQAVAVITDSFSFSIAANVWTLIE